MAQSTIGGAFGYLRKSIGSVTYATSTASIDGKKKQIARMRPSSVANPKTLAQIVQRMKVGPAQKFYEAFDKAAGSVENNPLSHSFQGIPYGNKNRLRFLQLAMTGDPKAYVPNGINYAVPGVYQVSEGSLPNMPSGVTADAETSIMTVGATITSSIIEGLAALGVEAGDQLTCLALVASGNGMYKAVFQRVTINLNAEWDVTYDPDYVLQDLTICPDGFEFTGSQIACAALILSRGVSSSNAKRSTAVMTMSPAFASLLSPEAFDAAVRSYIEGVKYNSLNSDWYLNQGTTQAFNGEVFKQYLTLAAGSGLTEVSGEFILGRQSVGGNIVYTIFTSNGTSSGTAYMLTSNGWETAAAYTAARVATALGSVNIEYAQYSDDIAAQLSGNV